MPNDSKVVINLATGLEDPERVTLAFLVAGAAAQAGKQVTMFLSKEAVRLALGRILDVLFREVILVVVVPHLHEELLTVAVVNRDHDLRRETRRESGDPAAYGADASAEFQPDLRCLGGEVPSFLPMRALRRIQEVRRVHRART